MTHPLTLTKYLVAVDLGHPYGVAAVDQLYTSIQEAAWRYGEEMTTNGAAWVYCLKVGAPVEDVTAECRQMEHDWYTLNNRDLPEWLGGTSEEGDPDDLAQRGYDEAREARHAA